MSQRLPVPGSDDGDWGDILNGFLEVSLASDGTLNSGVVGTSQIVNNAVTNAQLDVPTQTTLASVASKYTKPSGGIPSTDMTAAVQNSLSAAGSAIQPGATAGGDLSGTLPNPTIAKLQGIALTATGASAGQVLGYSSAGGGEWVPSTVSSTAVNNATTSAPGLVQLAGDLGGTSTNATAPTLANTSNVQTVVNAIISTSSNVTDKAPLASPTFTGKVTTPALQVTTGAGTSGQVLTSDSSGNATWVTPAAGAGNATTSQVGLIELSGDLGGTATSPVVAKLNGGISLPGTAPSATGQVLTTSGTGASATTVWSTPAAGVMLDSTASDIQPDTITGNAVIGSTGKAADAGHQHTLVSHDHSTANKGGQITPSAGLAATGTASSTTYLRGDNTWSTVAGASNATSSTPGLVQLSGSLGGTATSPTVVTNANLTGDVTSVGNATTVAKLQGVTLSSPSGGATSFLNATGGWTTPAGGVTLDPTASDIQPLGTQAAGSIGKAADAGHVHTMPRLDQVSAPTASVVLNSQKITGLANGSASTDAAAFGQIPIAGTTSGTYAAGNDSRLALPAISGIVADGVTDNYAVIMNALAASSIVRLPAGNIAVSAPILLGTGQKIYGSGGHVQELTNDLGYGTYILATSGFSGSLTAGQQSAYPQLGTSISALLVYAGQYSEAENLTVDALTNVANAVYVASSDCSANFCSFNNGSTLTLGSVGSGASDPVSSNRFNMNGCWTENVNGGGNNFTSSGADWLGANCRFKAGTKNIGAAGSQWTNCHFTGGGPNVILNQQNLFTGCYFDSTSSSALIKNSSSATLNCTFTGCKFYQATNVSSEVFLGNSSTCGVTVIGGQIAIASGVSQFSSFISNPNNFDVVAARPVAEAASISTSLYVTGSFGYTKPLAESEIIIGGVPYTSFGLGWLNVLDEQLGDGSDGAVTFDGSTTYSFASLASNTYTLSRDVMSSSIAVNSSVKVITAGFGIFCTGTVTVSGTINNNGGNASGATAGAAATTSTYKGGTIGATGITGSGAAGTAAGSSLGGSGGSGGASGANTAGAGGTASQPGAAVGGITRPRHTPSTIFGGSLAAGGYTAWNGGGGGGGGAGDGTNAGGGGGGGGGIVMVASRALVFSGAGIIESLGGNGGNGSAGNAAGGGGGGGGALLLNTTLFQGTTPTASANCTGGSVGTSSGSGTSATAGSNGRVYLNLVV